MPLYRFSACVHCALLVCPFVEVFFFVCVCVCVFLDLSLPVSSVLLTASYLSRFGFLLKLTIFCFVLFCFFHNFIKPMSEVQLHFGSLQHVIN